MSLKDMPSADVAELLEEAEEQRIELFKLVEGNRQARVFSYLPFELQETMIDDLPEMLVASVLNDMEPVDRTQFLEDLNYLIRDRLIRKMTPEERAMARELLAYPEESVGRMMNPEFLSLKPNMKVHEAIDYIRWNSDASDLALENMFVMDVEGKYLGDIRLKSLILSPTQSIRELMIPAQSGLDPFSDQVSAVDQFRKYDRNIAPVVNEEGIVIGVVSADDIFDVAEEEATEDIQQFGGQATLEDSYFATSVFQLFKKRGGWLCILFIGEIFASSTMHLYDDTMDSLRMLIYYLPLIISSGGNTGTQAASLIIRGLAVKEMEISDWGRVFKREVVTGIGLGLALGIMGYISTIIWGHSGMVSWIVFISVVLIVVFGSTLGSMLPFIFKRFNLDPAVSSSPFIACVVDFVGIVLYFSVATFMLRMMG